MIFCKLFRKNVVIFKELMYLLLILIGIFWKARGTFVVVAKEFESVFLSHLHVLQDGGRNGAKYWRKSRK